MRDAIRLEEREITVIDGDVRVRGIMPWTAGRLEGIIGHDLP
jgi:hypothetical protein